MAILFWSSGPGSGWLLSLKVLLASTTVLSMAAVMRTSVPVIADFLVSEAPSVYGSVLSWLRPPYLYVLINCIIISIVASSKLQNKLEDEAQAPLASPAIPIPIPEEPIKVSVGVTPEYAPARGGVPDWSSDFGDEKLGKVDVVGNVFGGAEDGALDRGAKEVNDDDEAEVLKPLKLPERNDSTAFLFLDSNDEEVKVKKKKKKPTVSARLPTRRSAKSNLEGGKALGVSKQKRHDTLESTWKAITDGRAMPLARHLRKSDAWDNRLRRNDENTPPPPASRTKKSETFPDRSDTAVNSNVRSPSPSEGSGKLRREPSLGQEELNRRVEAFIRKFNEEMRLQRQESLNQYQEMVRRGEV